MVEVVVEERYTIEAPDISHLETENDDPVDNIFSAKQQRLLVVSLYLAWRIGRPFIADANVGVFSTVNRPALVPDMFLSLDVSVRDDDWWKKENRSYFLWEYGKPPDVVVEVVSNRVGGEADRKLHEYARMGVPYYVIFDPQRLVQPEPLVVYELRGGAYVRKENALLDQVGLSLRLWEGVYEGGRGQWLRWADAEGTLLPTGEELVAQERQRAERLAARLREVGIDPDEIT